jgi:F0F1-type ATP synthase gamma subunit
MQINELKNKLSAIKSIKKISNAMKSISISKMKSAQILHDKFNLF